MKIDNKQSDKSKIRAIICGNIFQIIATASSHQHLGTAYLTDVVLPAIAHRNVKVYFNDMGVPVGYVIWAYLSDDVEKKFKEENNYKMHISEWNEGKSLWIIDLLAPFGHFKNICRDIKKNVFRESKEINFFAAAPGRNTLRKYFRRSI
ncbi:toxin-activating lysine-acyltransferase [Duganella levis]|uniref:toxin-activating lysine-acyltransferase n=1 Tax=Duganella levis TaxID=2692169 RepID=UPI00136F5F4F|nr:toxin-activating lysine-acyltransferase [Duganella levis]